MGKTYSKWVARVNDAERPWTESEIIYCRKATGHCGLKSHDERIALTALLRDTLADIGGYKITAEQDAKGCEYLLSQSVRKNGEKRKGCKLAEFDIAVLTRFSHHLFVGMYYPQHGFNHWFPIYRAVAVDGSWFEYVGCTYSQLSVLRRSEPTVSARVRSTLRLVVGG